MPEPPACGGGKLRVTFYNAGEAFAALVTLATGSTSLSTWCARCTVMVDRGRAGSRLCSSRGGAVRLTDRR